MGLAGGGDASPRWALNSLEMVTSELATKAQRRQMSFVMPGWGPVTRPATSGRCGAPRAGRALLALLHGERLAFFLITPDKGAT